MSISAIYFEIINCFNLIHLLISISPHCWVCIETPISRITRKKKKKKREIGGA